MSFSMSKILDKVKQPEEQVGYTPEQLIQMALGGTRDYMDKKAQHEKEYKNFKNARPQSGTQTSSVATDPQFGPPSAAPVNPNDVQSLVQQLAAQRGWSGSEWDALYDLISRESSWNPNAANPGSSARGLFQFVGDTARNYGLPADVRQAPLDRQVEAGLQYIQDRYTTPSGALSHWLARKPINGRDVGNWY